jgi:hypothetical protein
MEIPKYKTYSVVQPPNSGELWNKFCESRKQHGVMIMLLHEAGVETSDDDFWLSFRIASSQGQNNGTISLHGNSLVNPPSVIVAQINCNDSEPATVVIVPPVDGFAVIDEAL